MNRLLRNASLILVTGTMTCALHAQGTMPPGGAPSPAPSSAGEGYPGNVKQTQPRQKRTAQERRKHSAATTGRHDAQRPDAPRGMARDPASEATRRPANARPATAAPSAAAGAPAVQTQSDRVDATGAAPSTGEATRTPAAAPNPTR
jgi:hypothetical protein